MSLYRQREYLAFLQVTTIHTNMTIFTKVKLSACVMLIVLAGCTQQVAKQLTPFAGSKSDGTVTLAYEYDRFEQPVVDWQQGDAVAKDRCDAWGYKGAESFGVPQSKCLTINGYGTCMSWRISKLYQCLDTKSKKSS